MKTVAFIGAGNMGSALIRAACKALGSNQVLLSDGSQKKAQELADELRCTAVENNAEAVQGARYIFLCVKPQVVSEVLSPLVDILNGCHAWGDDKVIVSIAAGVQIESIRNLLGEVKYRVPVLRVMPNTCAAIGQGMLALSGEGEENLCMVEKILSKAGRVERLPETLMDQFTAVAGCGPAYVYQIIESLADGGVMVGLPRQQAQIYAAQTVLGAAEMVLQSGQHPGALKDAVCSPGGSTIAGVAAMERNGVRAAMIEAVVEAYKKNTELGK